MGEMMEATESWSCRYDGEEERIEAGRTSCVPDHELVQRYPGRWRKVTSPGLTDRSGCELRGIDPKDGRTHALVPVDDLARNLGDPKRVERLRAALDDPRCHDGEADVQGVEIRAE